MLQKLTHAIKAEYAAPLPDRKTALAHFQALYHVEKRGGCWYVDRSIRKLTPTGNSDADAIIQEVSANG